MNLHLHYSETMWTDDLKACIFFIVLKDFYNYFFFLFALMRIQNKDLDYIQLTKS